MHRSFVIGTRRGGQGGPSTGRGVPLAGHPWPPLAIAWVLACSPTPTVAPQHDPPDDGFSGARALATLATWLEHPRGLGDPRRERSIAELVATLERRGAQVERIDHEVEYDGTRWQLGEIVAHVRPEAPRRFVLATHFDTRPWADEEEDPALRDRPVPGANDGTSGLAVVLELLAPLRDRLPPDVGFSIVLFDGEELGRPGDRDGYCMGSRFLAERIAAGEQPLLAKAELGIVLDLVGDRDLHLPIEPTSQKNHPQLVAHIWRTAATMGIAAFEPAPRAVGIVDDHKYLSAAGIPSVLLIDREYAAWHRTGDTIDRIAAASLDAVGDVVLQALLAWFDTLPR
jgi:peptidase M28-like protein